ncbi:E3 ubiquitin-protein ligase SIAH1A-like [Adelges cooleyi]|uniref:E3 ubiquitin-protein ligase SIAH1A-like n=1 Tax=Adelges cooleyi TaxID=133065 RepID=UPI00217FB395|nr:E3 ubiquitin-protein ligase SIAH1A-like [Adelges cooleyi]
MPFLFLLINSYSISLHSREQFPLSNNSRIVDYNHHLVAEQETRMSGSGGSNSSGPPIGNPTTNGGNNNVSVLLPSGGGGGNSTHNSNGSSSYSSASIVSGNLASLFDCPVCFDHMLPPILQCQSGHLVCSACRPKLNNCCPTCRGPIGCIRNLAMEKVASTVMFPCKYSSSGCPVSLLHSEKIEHEELCERGPYACPCPGEKCKWQGGLEQVMGHLMVAHKTITTLQGEDTVFLATDINLPGVVDWVMMQSCFGHHFMLVLEKQEKYDGHQQFFAVLRLIGSRKQCEKFAYRLELNGHQRRLAWEATPRSVHQGVSQAILNSDCLVFDTSTAQLFADNGNLGIYVTISTYV